MSPLVLDTGALIALERRRHRAMLLRKRAQMERALVVVPGVCVGEWWRGRTDVREAILASVLVEHTDDVLVKLAGEALASVPTATCIDAVVMATAARHGGVVLTSDVGDMLDLQMAFPSVRVLAV